MRILKRLFPVFLVAILLAGLTMAHAAGAVGAGQSPRAGVSNTLAVPGYSQAPGSLRLDFENLA
jgi:hypothetical protein